MTKIYTLRIDIEGEVELVFLVYCMKYKCMECGFIHEGEMPDGYFCPLCLNNFNSFELIEEEQKIYNRVKVDEANNCINRVNEKCINCGACSKTCQNIVGIKYDSNICDGICIGCGQCVLTCPTGALTPKYDYQTILNFINDPDYKVAVLTSPACRVALGDAFKLPYGEFVEGKMVSALRKIGFDYVFDTTFGADMTAIEEAHELYERINSGNLPMYSSCCPSWVRYVSIYKPEIIKNLSTVKSPIGMASTAIMRLFGPSEGMDTEKIIFVTLTPCTSKKAEIVGTDTDYSITTSELALMIREKGIDFNNLDNEEYDRVKGSNSGVIFGASSGVTKSVLRCLYYEFTHKDLKDDMISIVEKDYYKEIKVKIKDRIITCIVVSTMPRLEKLLKDGVPFDFAEVMNCDGGCISGGGQIITPAKDKENIKIARSSSLMKIDSSNKERYPYKNDLIEELYNSYLDSPGSKMSLEYLHTTHLNLSYLLKNKMEK